MAFSDPQFRFRQDLKSCQMISWHRPERLCYWPRPKPLRVARCALLERGTLAMLTVTRSARMKASTAALVLIFRQCFSKPAPPTAPSGSRSSLVASRQVTAGVCGQLLDSEGGLLLVSLSGYASLYNVNTDLQLFGSALHTAMQDATVGARR